MHDDLQISSVHSVLNGLTIWENFDTSHSAHLKNRLQPDSMTVFVITKGKGTLVLNRDEVQVRENSMIQISPGTLRNMPRNNQAFTITGISFTANFLKDIGIPQRLSEIFNYYSAHITPVWHLEPEDMALIRRKIHVFTDRVKNYAIHPFGREILIHEFNIFLFEIGALVQKYSQMTRLTFSRQEQLVVRFSNLAQQHFRGLRTVKKYADKLNVTAKYLNEVVKNSSGKKASEIINDLVILEAKFLLQRSEMSIGQIAEHLNFSDQSFFGSYFKRHTGLSPKVYRKNEFQLF